jgi:hypothetical protein
MFSPSGGGELKCLAVYSKANSQVGNFLLYYTVAGYVSLWRFYPANKKADITKIKPFSNS